MRTPTAEKMLAYLSKPRTLHEIAAHLGESYDSSKRRCKLLWLEGALDKVDIEDPGQKGSKLKYVVGTGKRKARERHFIPPQRPIRGFEVALATVRAAPANGTSSDNAPTAKGWANARRLPDCWQRSP